jgi:mannose-1-phosphate guanylyltransferase
VHQKALQEPLSDTLRAIVLAGGQRGIARDLPEPSLPKPYIKVTGARSMLERTWERIERLIPAENIYTLVSERHLSNPEIRRQLSVRPAGTVIVQPENKDTCPGILLSLMYVRSRFSETGVAIFPADHFIREESWYMRYVSLAAQALADDPRRILILGVVPRYPETQYSYILPETLSDHSFSIVYHRVVGLVEKPPLSTAIKIVRSGGLWNTMTMIFKANTILDLIRREAPDLHAIFQYFGNAIGTDAERDLLRELYADLKPINFSRDLLQRFSERHSNSLGVVPVRDVFWRVWGLPDPIVNLSSKASSKNRKHWRIKSGKHFQKTANLVAVSSRKPHV